MKKEKKERKEILERFFIFLRDAFDRFISSTRAESWATGRKSKEPEMRLEVLGTTEYFLFLIAQWKIHCRRLTNLPNEILPSKATLPGKHDLMKSALN